MDIQRFLVDHFWVLPIVIVVSIAVGAFATWRVMRVSRTKSVIDLAVADHLSAGHAVPLPGTPFEPVPAPSASLQSAQPRTRPGITAKMANLEQLRARENARDARSDSVAASGKEHKGDGAVPETATEDQTQMIESLDQTLNSLRAAAPRLPGVDTAAPAARAWAAGNQRGPRS